MTKKKVWQIAGISFLCVCVLAVGVLGVVFGMNHTSEPVNLATADTQDETIEYEMTYSNGIELFMSSAPATNEFSYSKKITAIVTPEYAFNKEVDWSISWVNPEGELEMDSEPTSFIELDVDISDSRIASIYILKAFHETDILITCTTRVGGYKATCIVRYLGIPRNLSLRDAKYQYVFSGDDYYILENSSCSLKTYFDNPFGSPSDEYMDKYLDLDISIEAVGSFTIKHSPSASVPNGYYSVELSYIKDYCDISVAINGESLVLTASSAIEDFSSYNFVTEQGETLSKRSYYYSGAENCYWIVTVLDNYSGAGCEFFVHIYSDPESVELQDEILF